MAHARRKICDVRAATASPIAEGALQRIAALYEIEDRARGRPADERRRLRHAEAAPLLPELRTWLAQQRAGLPSSSKLASAFRYSSSVGRRSPATSTTAGTRSTTAPPNGRCASSPWSANYLLAGSAAGGERAEVIYTLIETAKLSGENPYAWSTAVAGHIADHPARKINESVRWAWSPR